jgi:probable phosphoglycerate mutase
MPIIEEPALREPDYGEADGLPWSEVLGRFDGIPALRPDLPLAPGGEAWTDYLARSTVALTAILGRHRGQKVLLVGHGETVSTACTLFLQLVPGWQSRAALAVDQASVTRWQQHPVAALKQTELRRWVLVQHNDTCHLHRDLMGEQP